MRGNKTMSNTYADALTKTVDVNGTSFTYRETGQKNGIPVVLLHHLTAVLDDWDPRTIDSLAQKHRVIVFNNRGVGGSKGTTPDTIDDMATDAVAFIRALGRSKTDLLGFSACSRQCFRLAFTSRRPTVICVGRSSVIGTGLRSGSRTLGIVISSFTAGVQAPRY